MRHPDDYTRLSYIERTFQLPNADCLTGGSSELDSDLEGAQTYPKHSAKLMEVVQFITFAAFLYYLFFVTFPLVRSAFYR
jgi:hypothetical protein